MDSALQLRIKFDNNESLTNKEIELLLEKSKVVRKVTSDYEENAFFNIFRLMCLSEIPYVEGWPYTKKGLPVFV